MTTRDDGVTQQRLRVLVVSPTLPYPPNWGFGIRVFNIITELSRTCDVTVACYADPLDAPKADELRTYCSAVHWVPSPLSSTRRKRWIQIRSLLSRRSFQQLGTQSADMMSLLHSLLSNGDFDIVQLESSQLSSVVEWGRTPLVLDEHNIEYELLQRMHEVEHSRLRKAYNWLEYRKFRTEETAAWKRADGCAVTSERELRVVQGYAPEQITRVIPNGVDVQYFVPSATPAADPDSIVFTGLMSYRPNSDAVTWFAREIMPLVLQKRPNAVFTIVGLGAHESVGSLAGPNVRVLSDVPDVRPYVWAAAVFAVPLRMGSGTRLKILEALAMGKAVASTTVGCEGIAVVGDEHLVVADEPVAFADAVVRLMIDTELNHRLGVAGRDLVTRQYSWVSIVSSLEALHREVLSRRGSS